MDNEAIARNRLDPWGRQYLQSMQENRPEMYEELKANGTLYQTAVRQQNQATQLFLSLRSQGVKVAEAQSQALQECILVPAVSDNALQPANDAS